MFHKKITEIKNHQKLELSSVKEKAEVSALHFASNSNKISVSDGDHVQISFRKFNMIIGPVLMVMMILIPLFFSIEGVTRLLIMLPFLLAVFFVGICMLKLEVVDKGTQEFSG